MQYGTPISSSLAYLFPMLPDSSYITSKQLSSLVISFAFLTSSFAFSFAISGNIPACIGASVVGSESHSLSACFLYAISSAT